jgi:hypothetical protein
MALTDEQLQQIEFEMKGFLARRRPPDEIRDEVDLSYRVRGQSVEIFEIRPRWRDPGVKMEIPVAKATYVRTREIWKIYWQRSDLKWHGYEPLPAVGSLRVFLTEVDKDPYGCFWG